MPAVHWLETLLVALREFRVTPSKHTNRPEAPQPTSTCTSMDGARVGRASSIVPCLTGPLPTTVAVGSASSGAFPPKSWPDNGYALACLLACLPACHPHPHPHADGRLFAYTRGIRAESGKAPAEPATHSINFPHLDPASLVYTQLGCPLHHWPDCIWWRESAL